MRCRHVSRALHLCIFLIAAHNACAYYCRARNERKHACLCFCCYSCTALTWQHSDDSPHMCACTAYVYAYACVHTHAFTYACTYRIVIRILVHLSASKCSHECRRVCEMYSMPVYAPMTDVARQRQENFALRFCLSHACVLVHTHVCIYPSFRPFTLSCISGHHATVMVQLCL
jgi:hypothetical protein